MTSIRRLCVFVVVLLLVGCGPSFAWLYDGGIAQHAGAMMRNGSSQEWIAQPFDVATDAYATAFGAAMGRAYGPAGAGFTVYLTSTLVDVPNSAIASWTIAPLDATLTYYYVTAATPIFLAANTSYALVFAPNVDGYAGSLSYSGVSGYSAYNTANHGASWSLTGFAMATRVDGYYVPEPMTAIALVTGCCGFWLKRRKS